VRCYLDHNATTPLRPEAKDAVLRAMELQGNASSVHAEGRAARALIEEARADIAALVGTKARNVIFTSGGSEAAAFLLTPGFRREGKPAATRLIVSSIEHSCVLTGGRFAPDAVFVAPVTRDGVIDLEALEKLLSSSNQASLVALMLANNETGIIQPVKEAARLVHARGGYLVADAVQALGKMEFSLSELGADAVFISGHKIGALPGVGAVIRGSDDIHFPPLIKGGGQESGLRAGSENLSGIASFGAAARVLMQKGAKERVKIKALRDFMEARLCTISPMCEIVGQKLDRLANTSELVVPGRKAETLLIALDMAGIAVGAGSACTSGKLSPSHVLTAMGRSEQDARSALRVSLGWTTTDDDIEFLCAEWARLRVSDGSKAA
jgi:cysteine desulfurase